MEGETVIVSDASLSAWTDNAIMRDTELQPAGVYDAKDAILKACKSIIRQAIKNGEAFHIGKGFYDMTVWACRAEAQRIAELTAWMELHGKDEEEIKEIKGSGFELSHWATEYADIVGLAGK